MNRVLVDSNVLLDVATRDPTWAAWSKQAIASCTDQSTLVMNAIIYAEVSVDYRTADLVDQVFPPDLIERVELPYEAAFLAGKAFGEYRRRGGVRTVPLPDFFIGAHAQVAGYRLLTRDPARFRTYFPSVPLIAPPGKS